MQSKTGVLLVNLGTPDSTKTADVRKYLREFLSDRRVIDVHPIGRFLLVNLIIAPFRAPKSAAEYRKLWTEKGSPLLFHSVKVTEMLQNKLGDQFDVKLAMRYQSPSISKALGEFEKSRIKKLIVIPLFPQYASATNGSVHDEVMRQLRKWELLPELQFIDSFPTHPKVIETFAQNGKKHLEKEEYGHVIFSYHGLPERQLKKADPECKCDSNCCSVFSDRNRLCYRAQCFETSRHLAKALNIPEEKYTVSFQSRLGKDPWIQPYTDATIEELAKKGVKKILAFSPAFVADCLETTIEIGEAYAEDYEHMGGEKLQLVESLNDNPLWVEALEDMVRERS